MTQNENNWCFLDVDIHVMSWNIFCHYILFCIKNTTIRCTFVSIDLSQLDCTSLKLKNFYTGELCEPAETKFLFLIPFLLIIVLLPHLWRVLYN